MVDKVDIISAPSKFSVQPQQKTSQPATKPEENNNRKVDWKTIGIAGTALAAIIGGIILVKRGNASKAAASATETTPPVDPEKALKDLFEKYKDKFMLVDKLTFENFKNIINSPEFAKLQQMRGNTIRQILPSKMATDRLAITFGDDYPRICFERTLRSTKEDIIKDIAERNYFLTCNKAVVDAVDAFGKPIKYRDGYSFIPYYAQINPMTNKLEIIPSSGLKIYSDRYGRYVRAEKSFPKNFEFEYIDPKVINEETPRLTTVVNNGEMFRLAENGDENMLMIYLHEMGKDNLLAVKYNPETKQIYEAYINNANSKTKSPIPNKDALSEIAEIFDFTKLTEKDYLSTLRGMISEVLK